MFNLNEAFDKLRRKVPTFAYEKRLSRIETLRLAITYIGFMTELMDGSPGSGNGGPNGHENRSPEIYPSAVPPNHHLHPIPYHHHHHHHQREYLYNNTV